MVKWILITAGILLLVLVIVAFALDIPRFVWGIYTYGSQRREGDLKVGDDAPLVTLHQLNDGQAKSLSDWIGSQPVVLIFGSCT